MENERKVATATAGRLEEYADWKTRYDLEPKNPRELFRQVSRISLCMSYDLIDKLRWWEKETLELTDDEIAERLPHMAICLDRLRTAYLQFTDVDF